MNIVANIIRRDDVDSYAKFLKGVSPSLIASFISRDLDFAIFQESLGIVDFIIYNYGNSELYDNAFSSSITHSISAVFVKYAYFSAGTPLSKISVFSLHCLHEDSKRKGLEGEFIKVLHIISCNSKTISDYLGKYYGS